MIDQLIILAPLLVLAIVLWLLGFTGCSIIYYLDDLPQLRRLTILGTNIRRHWKRRASSSAGPSRMESTALSPRRIRCPIQRTAVTTCFCTSSPTAPPRARGARTAARACATPAAPWIPTTIKCSFNLDGTEEDSKVTFQASGTPTDGNFTVTCIGTS